MNFVKVDGFPYVFHPNRTFLRILNGRTKEIHPFKDDRGYMKVILCNNGKQKNLYVHRLLALAFIPNPENKPCVDHINGIKDDNRLENLRWLTHKENMNAFRTPRPVSIITKGGICKSGNSWLWQYYMSGKRKTKMMKNLEDLKKYRKEKLISLGHPPSS